MKSNVKKLFSDIQEFNTEKQSVQYYGIESLEHQFNSNFGDELTAEFKTLRGSRIITNSDLIKTNINEIIFKHTGILTNVLLEEGDGATAIFPALDKNNAIINEWRKYYLDNIDSDKLFKNPNGINGVVNLKTGKVSGDFSLIENKITIGHLLLIKDSAYSTEEVTAALLHEIGHIFFYFAMLIKTTITNCILIEGVNRLINANGKEQKIKLIKEIENVSGSTITQKDKIIESSNNSPILYATILISDLVKPNKYSSEIDVYSLHSFEQMADQYVCRFGYGKHLATCLNKMFYKDNSISLVHPMLNMVGNILSLVWDYIFKDLKLRIGLAVLGRIAGVPILNMLYRLYKMYILFLCTSHISEYDSDKDRILKIKNQINDALKTPNLSHEIKIMYIRDFNEISKIYDDLYNNLDYYETLFYYLTPRGRKQRTQIEQNTELEKLFNNDLFTANASLTL